MNPNARVLSYSFGNAYGPNAIHGRVQLDVTTQDNYASIRLEHQQLDNVRTWTGVLKPEAEQALWDALARSDFPHTARPVTVVPDTTMCEIGAQHPELFPDLAGTSLPQNTLKELPGYKELIEMLHTVISQITEDVVTGAPDIFGETVVSDVRLGGAGASTDS